MLKHLPIVVLSLGLLLSCGTSSTQLAHVESTSPKTEKQPDKSDEQFVAPEIVHCKNVQVLDDVKTIIMSNANGDYHLSCNRKAAGCLTPAPAVSYYLFNDKTRWKMPGAKTVLDLSTMQDWTVTYNKGENIGLISQDNDPRAPGIGMYMLDTWVASEHPKK